MAQLAAQEVLKTGLTPAYAACAAGGDSVPVGAHTFIHVKNASGGSHTVTVASGINCDQGFDHDLAVAIPAGQERMIGPLPAPRFADANQLAQITYSAVTSLTIAVLKTV